MILPRHNFDHSLAEVPAHVRNGIEFISAAHIDDVFPHVFRVPGLAGTISKL